MNLKALETRYKYLREKEKIIRDTYDSQLRHEKVWTARGKIKGKCLEVRRRLNLRDNNFLKEKRSKFL